MQVRTLKRAAGAVSFEPDRIIELADELVQGFVNAGAVEVVGKVCESTIEDLHSLQVKDESGAIVENETAFKERQVEAERPRRKRK